MKRKTTGSARSVHAGVGSGAAVHKKEVLLDRTHVAQPRHQFHRFWLGLTLGGVGVLCATAYWWERQLPGRLSLAIQQNDAIACLKYSEQLAALRWLGQRVPKEQAVCRRRAAAEAWRNQRHGDALHLQEQLVNSGVGSSETQRDDKRTLKVWRDQLRDQALDAFSQGDMDKALALLRPLESSAGVPGSRLSDSIKETWHRNQLDHGRLDRLVRDERWWEALAVLNRLDHPWWQSHARPLRLTVEEAIKALRDLEEHHNHGELPRHTVSRSALDQAVQQRISEGLNPWDAFRTGCVDVGGRVEEEGPESLCRRR